MKKSMYIEIAIILFIVLIAGGILGSVLIKQGLEEEVVQEVIVSETNSAPSFSNIAPNIALTNVEYIYLVKAIDADNFKDELTISITQAPTWLSVDGFVVSGVPTEEDLGSHEVILELTDGENVVYNSFYILVEGINE